MLRPPRALLAALPVSLLVLTACGGGEPAATEDPREAVCEWLEDEMLPEMISAGSNLGAQTVFADEYASWVAEGGARPRTAAELDTLARQGCDDTRTRALTALGTESFADVLG